MQDESIGMWIAPIGVQNASRRSRIESIAVRIASIRARNVLRRVDEPLIHVEILRDLLRGQPAVIRTGCPGNSASVACSATAGGGHGSWARCVGVGLLGAGRRCGGMRQCARRRDGC